MHNLVLEVEIWLVRISSANVRFRHRVHAQFDVSKSLKIMRASLYSPAYRSNINSRSGELGRCATEVFGTTGSGRTYD
jgi:hypothetical protein